MTNAPNSGNKPEQSSTSESLQLQQQRRWRNFAIITSAILLTGLGAGYAWVWTFVTKQLAPLVEQNLSKTLDRPVQVGKVEGFSLNGLRFGATKLPATATDPDKVEIEAINVNFNAISFLLNRTLPLDVTIINPKVYIEQDEKGEWVSTRVKTFPKQKSDIDIKLEILRVKNADVVLIPKGGSGNSKAPIFVSVPSGSSQFFNDNKLIRFEGEGSLVQGNQKLDPPQPPLIRGESGTTKSPLLRGESETPQSPIPNPQYSFGKFQHHRGKYSRNWRDKPSC
jgi:translocation and assembly module TamB